MTLRAKFSLVFALVPLTVAIPSYLFGEHFTLSPDGGYHGYADLHWMVLSSLINAPLLGLAAYISWPLFGDRRDNLFYKSFIGNMVFGLLLPMTSVFVAAIAVAFSLKALNYFGISLWDRPMFLRPAMAFLPIWGSHLFITIAGGIVGVIFGRLRGLQKELG